MIKAFLFDLDDTLYDYEAAHQTALNKVFHKIQKTTSTSIEMLQIIFEISQKEIKRQLIGLAASHNRDLYFQRFFEHFNKEMKNKILPHEIIGCYEYYRKAFYKAMKSEEASHQLLNYLKKKKIKT
jgi:putative hydrolase of the HAD superfamily